MVLETPHEAIDLLTDEDVAAYLRDHPEFLQRHPDIIPHLLPPGADKGRGVIDLQHVMLTHLRRDLAGLARQQQDLVAATRAVVTYQSRVQAAVLYLLDARTFDHLIDIITCDLAVVLDIDLVSLVVERIDGPVVPFDPRSGLMVVEPGSVTAWMGRRDILQRDDVEGRAALYGAAAPLVRSEALVRLDFGDGAPAGLLALASRDPDLFLPGQDSQALSFLARVTERCVRGWLGRFPA